MCVHDGENERNLISLTLAGLTKGEVIICYYVLLDKTEKMEAADWQESSAEIGT